MKIRYKRGGPPPRQTDRAAGQAGALDPADRRARGRQCSDCQEGPGAGPAALCSVWQADRQRRLVPGVLLASGRSAL